MSGEVKELWNATAKLLDFIKNGPSYFDVPEPLLEDVESALNGCYNREVGYETIAAENRSQPPVSSVRIRVYPDTVSYNGGPSATSHTHVVAMRVGQQYAYLDKRSAEELARVMLGMAESLPGGAE